MQIVLKQYDNRYLDDVGIQWIPVSDALEEITKLKGKLAFIENQPLLVVKPPDAVIYENALDANREYRMTIDQLRKDNQALVEQVNAVGRKLEKAIEILDEYAGCPTHNHVSRDCDRRCKACWTAYFEGVE